MAILKGNRIARLMELQNESEVLEMKKSRNWLCGLTAVFLIIIFSGVTYGEGNNEMEEDKTLAPYFFIEGNDASVDQFPLKDTSVKTNINGVIADIYVTQAYANNGKKPISATYVFPASTRVSVHGMKMTVGNRIVTAKIKEKEEAKQEFEQAKFEGKSASLLEQQRPNVFTMSIANIMPGDKVDIELHYTELIVPDDGTYQYVFPTVVGPRYSNQSASGAAQEDKWVESPYLKNGEAAGTKFNIAVSLSTGVPIQQVNCTTHKVKINNKGTNSAEITLANPEEFGGNRDFILDYKLSGNELQSGLMLYKGEKENFFLMMMQPPERVKNEDIPPREYIFVLDVSGSMNGYPLDTAKKLIRSLISNLRNTDRFNLILFAGASRTMSALPVPATEDNVKKAISIIDEQEGGGGTEILPALQKAVSFPGDEKFSRSVIIITDGYIDVEKKVFELINNNLNKTNFFSFGIGSSVNRYLIDGIAKAGSGEPFVVTNADEADRVAGRFREYIQSPVLTDIKVKYNGFDAYDVEPVNIPELFAKRPVVLMGKWRGNPSGSIEITGKTGRRDYSNMIKVSDAGSDGDNSALRYLWARSRVERLSDYGTAGNDTENKEEVTRLGLEYSMLTAYTSFIAVVDIVRNEDGKSTDVNQPLPLPLGVSNLAVGGGYMSGDEPGLIILIAVALLLVPVVIILKRKRFAQ